MPFCDFPSRTYQFFAIWDLALARNSNVGDRPLMRFWFLRKIHLYRKNWSSWFFREMCHTNLEHILNELFFIKVEYIAEEQLMIALAGKQRQMRLIPVKALDQPAETEWIKVADTKNCITFATGIMRSSSGSGSGSYCLCVAVKRQVIIYEITRLKSRHKRLREVLLPAQAQSLDVFSEGRLCVGYQSGFTIYRYSDPKLHSHFLKIKFEPLSKLWF